MRRELWLLRHAKSAWDSDARTDFDRPLAKRGEKDAPRLGAWMAERGLVPDRVVTSPARRAEETLALLLEGMEREPDDLEVVREPGLYDARVSDLLAVVHAQPEAAQRVLLVGHNPGFEELLQWLSAERDLPRTAAGKLMTTCTLARLGIREPWAEVRMGRAAFLGLVRAAEL